MYEEYSRYGIIPENYRYSEYKSFENSRSNDNEKDKVLQIIIQSINDEKEDEMFYDLLIKSTASKEDKEIITSIRDDERKHRNLLKEVYNSLTGKEFVQNSKREFEDLSRDTYINLLKKAFFNEIKGFEKYRRVLNSMEDRKNYDKIFEVMSDEMKHAMKYNYLIAKNLV